MKTIRDAVHGDLQLSNDEMAFVDTPTFQRLRGVKQVGTSNLVFPSAVHTRFEHSLGTAWLAKRIADRLGAADRADRETAVLAALLHDVTHVPFGHTFEDERRLLEKHDRDPARLDYFFHRSPIGKLLDGHALGSRVRDVLENRPVEPSWVRQIVTGTVCADLLDYLKRDAYHCGLRWTYDERLLDYFSIVDGTLAVRLNKDGAFRHDVVTELVHLLQFRYTLTERVYYHHAKASSGAMVSRAVELALASGGLSIEELYELRDDALLDRLSRLGSRVDGLEDLMEDLSARRLYRRAYALAAEGPGRPGLAPEEQSALASAYHEDVARRREVERRLAERLGVAESHVILYCPAARMQLKEADVPVEVARGRVAPLSSLHHPDVESLAAKHRGLWRFYVLLSRRDSSLMDRLAAHCAEEFGFPNQRNRQASGEWSAAR
jgi:HD superfamily phosphohydrolase